jgi:hypothetical protein
MTDTTADNYLEIVHEYEDNNSDTFLVHAKETFWAVSPTPDSYDATNKETGNKAQQLGSGASGKTWSLFGGQSIYIHDIEDIKGMRELLDAIESRYIMDEMTKTMPED